ncbi:MAG TPA: APC family permease [Vicinamibacterales bacterium]|nr:APC family permease [Vicinamibacterales bacterium]
MTAAGRSAPAAASRSGLAREMGLLGLTATGICSMVGAGLNVIPFMIQRNVPGIGPNVLTAFLLGAVPAVLAGLAYAILASAMPRAGGSYVYASRALSPYLGFIASFSQWFSLCVAIGVVSYLIAPFLRDICVAVQWTGTADTLEHGLVRVAIALAFLWGAAAVNLRGVKSYERVMVPLMFLTFALGAVVIVAGFSYSHADFVQALAARGAAGTVLGDPGVPAPSQAVAAPLGQVLMPAAALLFASFIGFDSIAQAGGEAKRPSRDLPLAIFIAVGSVAVFYFLFTAAVYHAVPWEYVASEALRRDVTAPGLLGVVLPPFWTVVIVASAAVALIKDLPAMMLGVSRLMFAWAEDGIFPQAVSAVHPTLRTPHIAIVASAIMATIGVLGSHFAGDFFLGVDILVTSMLVNFLLMALSVLVLPARNRALAAAVTVLPARAHQVPVAVLGLAVLALFLAVHTWKDLTAPAAAWYFRSTPVWLIVMALGTVVYARERWALAAQGVDVAARFATLPPE